MAVHSQAQQPSPTLSADRLRQLLAACRPLRVAVIGDFNLDAYWYADMTLAELSREAPLYNRPVVRETYNPGGAANVAWNLADLGVGTVHALTVLGPDWRCAMLSELLDRIGVCLDRLVVWPGRMTPLFGKVWLTAHGLQQEDARLDFVSPEPLPREAEEALLGGLRALAPELDALVIADYHRNGVLSPALRAELSSIARQHPGLTCVADSREHIGDYAGMVVKPNRLEASSYLFPGLDADAISPAKLAQALRAWRKRTSHPIYVTLGDAGCLLYDGAAPVSLPAAAAPPPCDPVGAGDAFLSALAAALAAGAAPWEAGALANLAAGVTVRKLHVTGTARPEEILALHEVRT